MGILPTASHDTMERLERWICKMIPFVVLMKVALLCLNFH
nr:MAG TPA: protein of unknown function (DUF5359) [Bacteriophage sp.]